MPLYDDWCDQNGDAAGVKRYVTLTEKDGGREAVIDRLGETVRSHNERLEGKRDASVRTGSPFGQGRPPGELAYLAGEFAHAVRRRLYQIPETVLMMHLQAAAQD